jgi:quercetin dioxygenase-like cupin family protein
MEKQNKIKTDGSFDDLNLEAVIDPLSATKIISSTQMEDWAELSKVKQFPDKITKKVIPIDFSHYRMTILTKVEPDVLVDTHMHEEPVFRYVIEGEFELNGIRHKPGDWILVPGNTPYRVVSEIGYSVLASYGAKCGSPHDDVVGRIGGNGGGE